VSDRSRYREIGRIFGAVVVTALQLLVTKPAQKSGPADERTHDQEKGRCFRKTGIEPRRPVDEDSQRNEDHSEAFQDFPTERHLLEGIA
jgi:hypothetical protein